MKKHSAFSLSDRAFRTGLLFLAAVALWQSSFAQQDPLYSQYLLNPFIINPAYAGFSKDITGLAAYRVQWAGISGSPVTMNVSGHTALLNNKMGLGLSVLQDNIGTNKTTEFHVAYGYHIQMQRNSRVSFGLQAGAVNYRNDFDELIIDPNDPKFQTNISEFSPSIGAGIIFSSDRFYAGISVPKMLKGTAVLHDEQIIYYNRHAYAHAAYVFVLSHRLKIKPFALARYVANAPFNADAGAILTADDSYMLGLFTRNLNTYGAILKINLGDMLRVGYVFELPTNKSVGLNYTAHEITIGIRARLFRFHDISAITDF
ncbi:MAG: type IX secretion system membrane protein PorP/SprF [Cyclobacteriaceae bacterium]|nr:type IX secretion system membrane protein PorP/SprF [Cyclobacteriaceae bacterium]